MWLDCDEVKGKYDENGKEDNEVREDADKGVYALSCDNSKSFLW